MRKSKLEQFNLGLEYDVTWAEARMRYKRRKSVGKSNGGAK